MTIEKQKKIRYIPFYRLAIVLETIRHFVLYSVGIKRAVALFLKIWMSMLAVFVPTSAIVLNTPFILDTPILSLLLLLGVLYLIVFIGVTLCIKEQERTLC
jgi:hypothetical protein